MPLTQLLTLKEYFVWTSCWHGRKGPGPQELQPKPLSLFGILNNILNIPPETFQADPSVPDYCR